MRHLWSLLAGIVAAPLAWLGLATGQYGSKHAVFEWQRDGRFDTVELIGPVIFLLAVGVLLGLVGTLRWSPAGPLAAGVLLAIPTLFMFVNPFETLDAFSYDETNRILGQDLQLWRPVENGTLLVLGALLLMAVFSTQRWRQWPQLPRPIAPATDDEVVSGVAALSSESGSTMSDDEILAAPAALEEPEPPAQATDEPRDTGSGAPSSGSAAPAS